VLPNTRALGSEPRSVRTGATQVHRLPISQPGRAARPAIMTNEVNDIVFRTMVL
jgi:hypothetical protein